MTTLTPNLGLSKPDVGTVNWDTVINSNFDIIDTSLGGATVLTGTAGEDISDGDPVWYNAMDGSVMIARNTAPNLECVGIAALDGSSGGPISFILGGLKALDGIWAWTPGAKIFLADGVLVQESSVARIGDLDPELMVQRIGIAITAFEMWVNPDRHWRSKQYIVHSSEAVQSSGTTVTPSFNNISGARFERVFPIPSDTTSRTFVYTFMLPPMFREFAEIPAWAFRVGYNVASANRTVQVTKVHSGGANAVLAPTAGSSTTWADHSLAMQDINAISFGKGGLVYVEVTSAAGVAAAANLATTARLRFVPENGIF